MNSSQIQYHKLGFWLRSVGASFVAVLLGVTSAFAVNLTNLADYSPAVQVLQGSLPFTQNYDLSIVSPANYPLATSSTVTYAITVNAKPAGVSDATALSYLTFSSPSLLFTNPLETKIVNVRLAVPTGAVAGAYGFQIVAVGWPAGIVFDNVGASVNATTTNVLPAAPPTVVIGTPADGAIISVAPGFFPIQVPFAFTATANAVDPIIILVTATINGQALPLTSTVGLNTRSVSGGATLTISQPGTYSVVASATNAAGVASDTNQFTVSVTAAPPTVVINSPTPNSVYTYLTGSTATIVPFAFTANSNLGGIQTLTVKVDNDNATFIPFGLGTLQAYGLINLPYTTTGTHTVSVTTTDNYGTATANSNFTVNVVTPTPTITINQPTAGATFTAAAGATTVNVPYTFVSTSNNGFFVDSVSASLDGNAVTIGSTTGLGSATATSTGTLTSVAAGSHTLVVKGISAGIEVTTSTNFTVTAVTPPPTVVINTPAVGTAFTTVSGATALSIPLTFTGTSTPTSGVITQLTASLNGVNLSVSSTSLGQRVASGSATMTVSNAGTYTISVTAIDAYGTASTSRTFSVVVVQSRTIYGSAFFDVGADGNYDGEDFGLSGITVKLLDSTNQVIATEVTDSVGDYAFIGVAPGSYTVDANSDAGLKASTPSERMITISNADAGMPKFGFSLDFSALRTMSAGGYTIGYWKNNIDKAIRGTTSGTQVSMCALIAYTNSISSFALSLYDGLSLKTASSTMGYSGSTPSLLLSKQLLASEYNYQNGAYLNGNRRLTLLFLWWGEYVQANPRKYSSTYVLWTKDWFDAYNNSHGGIVAGPSP
jgi:PKD repeat protein